MSSDAKSSDSSLLWNGKNPASDQAVEKLQKDAGLSFPNEYLQFLRHSNGGEGCIDVQPGWLQLWTAEEVIENNLGYKVAEYTPGYFGFGSSGGGVMFAFDTSSFAICAIPFDSIDVADITIIAISFANFANYIGKE